LEHLFASSEIDVTTLVWRSGMDAWLQHAEVAVHVIGGPW